MDYLIENAKEIAFLCIGGGFLILVAVVSTFIWKLKQFLNKFDDLVELFSEYIYKPVALIIKLEKFVKMGLEFLKNRNK